MTSIYLIGPRACGKTTVGKILAQKLQLEFYDSDAFIVEKVGCDIAAYVKSKGWDAFRDLESTVLNNLSRKPASIISCGGGIVVREKNLSILQNSFTVYLKTDIDILAKRLGADPAHGQRPSLTGKPLVEELQEVLDARENLYSGCATLIVDGAKSIEEISTQILNNYTSIQQGEN